MGKKLRNYNEQSPWEFQVAFKKFSAILEISRFITLFTEAHDGPYLSQMNPTHTVPVYAFKIHLIISFYLRLHLPSHFFQFFPPKPCIYFSCHLCATGPTYLTLLHLIALVIFDNNKKSWSPSIWSSLHPVTSSLLATNIFPSILFSNTLSVFFLIRQTKVYTHIK